MNFPVRTGMMYGTIHPDFPLNSPFHLLMLMVATTTVDTHRHTVSRRENFDPLANSLVTIIQTHVVRTYVKRTYVSTFQIIAKIQIIY